MSNVNNRIQNFYNKGYQDALKDCDNFIKVLTMRFGYLKINNDATLEDFLKLAAKEMNLCYGGNIYNQPKEENNV